MWFEIRVSKLQYEFRVCQIGSLAEANCRKNNLRSDSAPPTNLQTEGRMKYGVTRIG